jgi:hypothetical protein
MAHLAPASHGLGPAKGFVDALADAPGDGIAGMAGGAAVDRRAPAALVLGNMRGHRLVAQLDHKVAGIERA